MAKRSDTSETVLLALELLRRIPRRGKITASQLHAQLANTGMLRELRTIQRQLEMLTEHYDIERDDRSKPYGYCWKEQAKGLGLPTMGEQESLLLMLAEQHLRNLLPAPLLKSMNGFFVQARSNLNSHGNAKLGKQWLSKVRAVSETQRLLPPKIQPNVFETVSYALYGNFWLNIEYRKTSGVQTSAEVMPLGLAQQGERLYLVCRYRGFDNERSLAMHRIQKAHATTLTFERPKEFDLEKYDNDGRFGFGNGKLIRLSFQIDKETGAHLLESQLSADQVVKEMPDTYRITATIVDSDQLDWWLRGFGDAVSGIRKTAVK